MKKSGYIAGAMIAMVMTSPAGVITYTFDEGNAYAAYQTNTTGLTVSDITYLQGATSDTSKVAGVAYQSNVVSNNMFAACALDIGSPITTYAIDVSRLEFNVTANVGTSMDFTGTLLSIDLSAITDQTLVFKTSLRLAYNINGSGWVTGVQKQVDTTLVASNLMDGVLFDDSTDALLEGYAMGEGAFVHTKSYAWSLTELGVLANGDVVEFALLVYDSRNAASYYTGIDNISINDVNVVVENGEPPPAPMVSFGDSGSFGTGQDVVNWTTVQGSGYVYSVYYTTNLTANFQPLATNLADTVQSWTNIIDAASVFYQIKAD